MELTKGQEKLLEKAGFKKDHLGMWNLPGKGIYSIGRASGEHTFGSTDWLFSNIWPAIRKEYGVFKIEFDYLVLNEGEIRCVLYRPNRFISIGIGKSEAEALCNALERLVEG